MKIKIRGSILFALLFSLIGFNHANAEEKRNGNNSALEKGFRFGNVKSDKDEKKDENVDKLDEKKIGKILKLLLKESKKQTKLQEEIRDILEDEYAPKAKMITMPNGRKCVENEDAKCFKMPIINNIKKIPAIRNALTKRDLKSVTKQEQWYAEYIIQVSKLAYLKGQAIRNMGPEYKLATRVRGTTDPAAGFDSVMISNFRKQVFEENLKHFEFKIFMGINHGLDMYSLTSIANIAKKNPKVKMTLVFKSKEAVLKWKKQHKNLYVTRHLERWEILIDEPAFKKFKIYTSPSLVLRDLKNEKDTLAHIGKLTEAELIKETIGYMLANKMIKRSDLSSRNAWEKGAKDKQLKFLFENKYGVQYEK